MSPTHLARTATWPFSVAGRAAADVWSSREPSWTGWAIAGAVRALRASWRIQRFVMEDGAWRERDQPSRDPACRRLYVLWHSDAIIAAATHDRLAPAVLASHHRDGERVSQALRRLGYPVVRGSTRRGGARAIFALSRLARGGHDLAVTPDGPLGPAGYVGPGVIEVARRAGLEIVPVGFAATPAWSFGTWDRTCLPWLGARIVIVYGMPVGATVLGGAPAQARMVVQAGLEAARAAALARLRGA